MNNSPNTAPSVTEAMIEAGVRAWQKMIGEMEASEDSTTPGDMPDYDEGDLVRAIIEAALKSAAPQHMCRKCNDTRMVQENSGPAVPCSLCSGQPPQQTGLTDVERGVRDILSEHLPHGTDFDTAAQAIAAMQQPVCADVERVIHKLVEAARMYEASCRLGGKDQEFASLKLDEARTAALLVSDRSGVE